MDYLSIDFETGSEADLRRVGAAKYAEDPSTRVICVAWTQPWITNPEAHGYGKIAREWVPPGRDWMPPAELVRWVNRGFPVRAWNAAFEYFIWKHHVQQTNRQIYGLRVGQLHDTMAQAAYWGLPLSLDEAGKALPELGIVKDMQGSALMKRMSRPRGKNPDGSLRWWDEEDPDKRDQLLDYCANDVLVESRIARHLPELPERERKIWVMDFEANARGIPLDEKLTRGMKKLAEQEKSRLDLELKDLTGGVVTAATQAKALAEWCVAQGLGDADGGLAKDRLPGLIDKANSLGLFRVSKALKLRQEAAKSSVAKLDAMLNYACGDGRMRFLTQYYGAFRTGRWAGRGPQVQNFPRPTVDVSDAMVMGISTGGMNAEGIELFTGERTLTVLSSMLRSCLWVPPGDGNFAALDFSQIEARVLAWLAGSEKILRAYREGSDLYKIAASDIYGVPVGEVDKDQRQVGKVSILALGYQGGVGAFQTMAKVYGLEIPDEMADDIKTKWRDANPEIVGYWYRIDEAAKTAVSNPGSITEVRRGDVRVLFSMWKGHLLVKLPSGRHLVYREAQMVPGKFGDVVSYMGVDQYTRRWTRIETYGGKLVENITQAVARDVLADAMLRVDAKSVEMLTYVLGSIHDEVLFYLPRLNKITQNRATRFAWLRDWMRKVPDWAEGLPLDADGYLGTRFGK